MASNSDALYYVLSKIYHHPEIVIATVPQYSNAVAITISDKLKISDSNFYFPDHKLMVNRLSPDFVAKNGDLLEYYFDMTDQSNPGYNDIWIRTGLKAGQNSLMIGTSLR